ncbi:unnamed protein product [Dibothriocephalus latus]|uniref:Uncharacterized protein n=1 Tax=Dibothriocephalus latus TaxID=60516 RepID=A0A3P6P5Q8_DIBLA|nr:unnamed protein product [Dibothriocephalus latus]
MQLRNLANSNADAKRADIGILRRHYRFANAGVQDEIAAMSDMQKQVDYSRSGRLIKRKTPGPEYVEEGLPNFEFDLGPPPPS